jgi:hypothetical protein
VQKLETIVVAGLLAAAWCVAVKCKQLYASKAQAAFHT